MEIGLDIGYSSCKLASDKGTVLFLSESGTPETASVDLGGALLGAHENGATIDLDLPHRVRLGAGAVAQSIYTTRRFDRGWIESELYKDLFLGSLTTATSGTYAEVFLVTGLPARYYVDDRATLRDLLMGEHRAQQAGRHAQTFKITDVRILPQGMGSLLSACLDDRGNLIDPDLARGTVAVVDIGGKTTNFCSINRLADVARETTSTDNMGGWKLVEAIKPWLTANCPKLSLRDNEIMARIRAGGLKYGGEWVDLRPIVGGLVDRQAEEIYSTMTQLWNGRMASFDQVLIAGGGAHLLGAALAKRIGRQARVLDNLDPVYSNAIGYYRLARRLAKG